MVHDDTTGRLRFHGLGQRVCGLEVDGGSVDAPPGESWLHRSAGEGVETL